MSRPCERPAPHLDRRHFQPHPNLSLPGGWLVPGLVYNVSTGLVDIVVPPAPIRNS